jgi:hypothetical protein
MNIGKKLTLASAVVISTFAATIPQAFAWSCQAAADDGTYGYSYNYPNRRGAKQRALAECNARTYDSCYIVDCQRNG